MLFKVSQLNMNYLAREKMETILSFPVKFQSQAQ